MSDETFVAVKLLEQLEEEIKIIKNNQRHNYELLDNISKTIVKDYTDEG